MSYEAHRLHSSDFYLPPVAINLLFDNWETLGLKGGAIKLFGRVEAFSIGERLISVSEPVFSMVFPMYSWAGFPLEWII